MSPKVQGMDKKKNVKDCALKPPKFDPRHEKQNVASAVKQPVTSWLHSEHIKQCGSSTDPRVDGLSPAVSGPLMEPVTSAVERLEGETVSSGHGTEDTNLEDTWENTLPQVQHIAKPKEESCARTAKCSGTERRADWEEKKRLYVSSVMRYMEEKRGTHNGVMSELLRVMNRVDDERAGKDGKRWQHPSDLTCRNYQRRFGTKPETTLREWQRKNYGSHERFSKVWFERCHCPGV